MIFNTHSNLEGRHAFLSASKYHWLNYDENKLISSYYNFKAVKRGTDLHELAKRCIELGVKLPKSKKTLNAYVNDAIGFQMTPELPLYYSENCFGTADAISFKHETLRIHDLKTGSTPASINQLLIYAALFCLEYKKKPSDLRIELRIYQNDDILAYDPSPEEIMTVMEKIVAFDSLLCSLEDEGV